MLFFISYFRIFFLLILRFDADFTNSSLMALLLFLLFIYIFKVNLAGSGFSDPQV